MHIFKIMILLFITENFFYSKIKHVSYLKLGFMVTR